MTTPLSRLLPRSLLGRVFALYAASLALFVGGGLALFYRYQFGLELETAMDRAQALVAVAGPAIADSAVIGDYDTIRRTLERSLHHSDFGAAAFIDLQGGAVRAQRRDLPDVQPPQWLSDAVAARLYDANQPIVVGGRDYGVLRLGFAPERIAGGLWRQARVALTLAALALGGGLTALWLALRGWLGPLGRLASIEAGMRSGAPQPALQDDAPLELRRTFDVLHRAAADLQAQRGQAAVTLDAIADGVFTLDAQGGVILANPAACEAVAMSADNVLGRRAHDLLPELFAAGARYEPWRARRVSILARDGSLHVLDTTLSPIAGPDGTLHGHVLACRDVSGQHALDQRLQEELRARAAALAALRGVLEGLVGPGTERGSGAAPLGAGGDIEAISHMISGLVQRLQAHGAQLNAIFSLSPDGFVSFDAAHRVNYLSPAFARLTGLDAAALHGAGEGELARQLASRCTGGAQALPGLEVLRAAAAGPSPSRRRLLVEVQRPTRRTLELTLHPGDGTTLSQMLHLRDVTHETEVDQMKSEFLNTAAHELRTPMASIFGYTELMMRRPLAPERQRAVIETVHRQTELMINIVNELLDLARIEARRGKDFSLETLELGALVAGVAQDFKPPQQRPQPVLVLPEAALPVRADRLKLVQALNNVLSNAYKYSPEGGEVRLELRAEAQRVGVRVVDQGIGMTPEQLARVSERFWRADASGAIPGTGLGMSIVKEIVELLGGSLELHSAHRQGTQVTLWLPLAPPGALADPVPVPADAGAA